MAEDDAKGEDRRSIVARWRDVVEDRWRKAGDHAEAYPYVWSSYILVYGGLGAFVAYKWRKLRRMEDRVRALQERARRHAEAEKAASFSSSSASSASASGSAKTNGLPHVPK